MEKNAPATMATMTPTMAPVHKEIPGNPSVAKSSTQKLNDRSNGKPLRVLSEADWKFWIHNGYIVIKNAVPKENCERLAKLLWEFEEKIPTIHLPGMHHRVLKCK
jgi:hypothetical protein